MDTDQLTFKYNNRNLQLTHCCHFGKGVLFYNKFVSKGRKCDTTYVTKRTKSINKLAKQGVCHKNYNSQKRKKKVKSYYSFFKNSKKDNFLFKGQPINEFKGRQTSSAAITHGKLCAIREQWLILLCAGINEDAQLLKVTTEGERNGQKNMRGERRKSEKPKTP